MKLYFIVLLLPLFCVSCDTHEIESKYPDPLVQLNLGSPPLGPDEILIDENFKIFYIKHEPKFNVLVVLRIISDGGVRKICTGIFYLHLKQFPNIVKVDFLGDNFKLIFDPSNSIIEQQPPGAYLDFMTPNHKAKCAPLLSVPDEISNIHFLLYTDDGNLPLDFKPSAEADTSIVKSVVAD